MYIFCLSNLVRNVSMCSLQSAGEAQGGHTAYQTDTRHIRSGLWGWERPRERRGTGSQLWGTVPSHAETNEWLYTAPPGDNTVRLYNNDTNITDIIVLNEENMNVATLICTFSGTWKHWKTQWTFLCAEYFSSCYHLCVSPLSRRSR
jgi:hypothetical protein